MRSPAPSSKASACSDAEAVRVSLEGRRRSRNSRNWKSRAAVMREALRGQRWLLTAVISLRAVFELLPLQIPLLIGIFVDALSNGGMAFAGIEANGANEIARFALVLAASLGAGQALAAYGFTRASSRLGAGVARRLRLCVLEHSFDPVATQTARSGELVDRCVTDSATVRRLVLQVLVRTTTTFLRAVYPVVVLCVLDIQLALVALAPLALVALVNAHLGARLETVSRVGLDRRSDLSSGVVAAAEGLESLRVAGRDAAWLDELDRRSIALEEAEVDKGSLVASMRLFTWGATMFGLAVVLSLAIRRVDAGTMTTGQLVAFLGLCELAYRPVRRWANMVKTYRLGLASLDRLTRVFEAETRSAGSKRPDLDFLQGVIRFDDIDVEIAGTRIFDGFSLKVPMSRSTAILGPSGCGKSTLLRLLVGVTRPDAGRVSIDGQDVEDVDPRWLRERIVYVPQRPRFFGPTLRDEWADCSDSRIREVLVEVGLDAWLDALPLGLDTRIDDPRFKPSFGEMQRLALARALGGRARMLLLDEPTAGLDAATEASIVELLRSLAKRVPIVLVTHRASSARVCDQIQRIGSAKREAIRA